MKFWNKIVLTFQPERCWNCLGKEFDTKDTSFISYHVCEFQEICKKCGKINRYWAYGFYDDPLTYMDNWLDRFEYLFLGIINNDKFDQGNI